MKSKTVGLPEHPRVKPAGVVGTGQRQERILCSTCGETFHGLAQCKVTFGSHNVILLSHAVRLAEQYAAQEDCNAQQGFRDIADLIRRACK